MRPSLARAFLPSRHLPRKVMSSASLSYAPERAAQLRENIDSVAEEIASAVAGPSRKPRLVAVSKLKPASDIQALYDAGHRHFGENYIQELVDKAAQLPRDIEWHFIGALQSNKAKLLASIPNLFCLETLSTTKVADILQKSITDRPPLNVYLQVNTSGEDAKSGLPPMIGPDSDDALLQLALHIQKDCPQLKVLGLMTIGSWEASHDPSKPNPDFECLKQTKVELTRRLQEQGVDLGDVELSMGMSADFVQAAKEGSSSVRVGTRIFGERPKKT